LAELKVQKLLVTNTALKNTSVAILPVDITNFTLACLLFSLLIPTRNTGLGPQLCHPSQTSCGLLWGAMRKNIISDRFSTKTAISVHI